MDYKFTFKVLSQLPVATIFCIPPVPSTNLPHLIGSSCAATCTVWPVVTSITLPILSTPPEKHLLPS